MKRDMDLIRSILLTIEDDPEMDGSSYKEYTTESFPGYSQSEIDYHVDLLFEADFVTGAHGANHPLINKLTWRGHEFIAATKDPDVWQRIKERIKGVTDVALPLVLDLGKDELKKKLGL